jgi:hypothetical protein
MIQDYSDKTVLIYDKGLFVSVAETLAKSFGQVLYFSPWKTAYPTTKNMYIGHGLTGVTRVNDFFDAVPDADLIMFPDNGDGDLQLYLEGNGCRVWGSRHGDELELYRRESREYQKKLGLDVNPYTSVIGTKNLRAYLKDHEDVYVKVSITRGDIESFHSENYKLIEPQLDEIDHILGPEKNLKEFIIEKAQNDCIETGMDGICIDGQYAPECTTAIELKDAAYCGKWKPFGETPTQIREFLDATAPAMREYRYRNFLSTDTSIDHDGHGYMRDLCARFGHPPSAVMQLAIQNLPDIFWFGAEGILINPVIPEKWMAQVQIKSSWAMTEWQPIYWPDQIRDKVKLANHCIIDGVDYTIPIEGLKEIGGVCATGATMDEAIKRCRSYCEQVEGYEVHADPKGLDGVADQLDKLKKYGITV